MVRFKKFIEFDNKVLSFVLQIGTVTGVKVALG